MKASSFSAILNAYARALKAAGAPGSAGQIQALSDLFGLVATSNVSDVTKRLQLLECTRIGRPKLGDVATLLEPLKDIVALISKPAAADLSSIETVLNEYANVDLEAFSQEAHVQLTRPSGKKSTSKKKPRAPVRDDLVDAYARKLEGVLGREEFVTEYERLRADQSVSADEIIAVAKRFTDAATRSKDSALKKIWSRHQALSMAKAKSRATGGKSAA